MRKMRVNLLWFIGLNTSLFIFRDAFSVVKFIYTASIVLFAMTSITKVYFGKAVGNGLYFIKILTFILSLLLSLNYSMDFFIANFTGLFSLFLLAVMFLSKSSYEELDAFIAGYKLSLLIDFIYAGIQLVIILCTGININNFLLFYIGHTSSIDAKMSTRIAGLCWDPYLLGMFCATGFFLFKSKIFKLYILILLYFSSSRAGQVGWFAAFCFFYWKNIRRWLTPRRFALVSFCFLFLPLLLPKVFDALDFGRGFNKKSVGWRRVEYIIDIPRIWEADESIFPVLFGGAPYYTGARFYYSEIESMTNATIRRPLWTIETDWPGTILGCGIIGFIVYVLLYVHVLLHSKNKILKALCLAIFVGGIGYQYNLAVFSNIIFAFALCALDLKSEIICKNAGFLCAELKKKSQRKKRALIYKFAEEKKDKDET